MTETSDGSTVVKSNAHASIERRCIPRKCDKLDSYRGLRSVGPKFGNIFVNSVIYNAFVFIWK